MLHMVRIEGAIVSQTIRELDIDGRVTDLHQFQIDQQTPGAVDEGMDALKFNMELGQLSDDVFGSLHIADQQLLHFGPDQIRLYRLVLCAHDADGDPAVHVPVPLLIRQDKEMDLLDYALGHGDLLLYQILDEIKGFLVTDSLQVILQGLLVDCQSTQDHVSLPERQCVALDGVAVVGVLNGELLRQPGHFAPGQRAAGIQLGFLSVDHLQKAFRRLEPSVGWLHRTHGDLPPAAFLRRTGDPSLSTKNPDSLVHFR